VTGPERAPTSSFLDALVLAGGAGRRLGGVVKADVALAGRSLLDRALDGTREARHVVVVGPAALARPGAPTVREDPPLGGPVAGIAAGLDALLVAAGTTPPDQVLVLACDMPFAAAAVPALRRALARGTADGAVLVDADGRRQPLAGVYRASSLARAVDTCRADGGVRGRSVRSLVAALDLVEVLDPVAARDADTWDAVTDLARELDPSAGQRGESSTRPHGGTTMSSSPQHQPVGDDLYRWVAAQAAALGVDPSVADVDVLLGLARDVSHGVSRPAVPLTSFLVGWAVGAGSGGRATLDRVVAQVVADAGRWRAATDAGPGQETP
jgi:molybdopterin-guanine dinucleotide biosynthesis protein A